MSTRGLTGFIADGKWYAMYNHSDSYPEWLGQRVVEWAKTVKDWGAVKKNVKRVVLVNDDKKPTKAQIAQCKKYYYNSNVDLLGHEEEEKPDWYWLLHTLQGVGILDEVAKGNIHYMIDGHEFIADSLFCEWAYIFDLDEKVLRVYKGCQQKPVSLMTVLPKDVGFDFDPDVFKSIGEKYYPCKELYAYSFDNLPEFMLGVTNEFKKEYRKEKKNG